ncbi:MAG: alkaline phosphatase D family protein, partial [Longimicrobiales bacterium]
MSDKTSPDHWFDLYNRSLSRRDVLRTFRDASALVLLGGSAACGAARSAGRPSFNAYPFSMGVASGDPDDNSAVLWTRLGREALDQAGLTRSPVSVGWEVATDDNFRSIVASGTAEARPELGHSVHVEAPGLRAASDYWYRFTFGDAESPAGRTRTAPSRDQTPEAIRFSFASCQNYEHGHFTALQHMADEQADVVLFLGDYLYESRFASGSGIVREHEAGEVHTLEEYRRRYETYRSQPELQAAHASAPWIATFDDHEVDNNWAGLAAEDDQTEDQMVLRMAAAFQAYYEFMPLRPFSMPTGPEIRIYRSLDYGRLMRFFVLDTRQYRTNQPCGDRTKVRCEGAFDPEATMLGGAQEQWLFEALSGSSARWNVLANQIMVAPLAREQTDASLGDELMYSMDRWDGYVEAQQRLTDFLGSERVSNPVIVAGDIHTSWINDIKRDVRDPESPTVAAEFVGTSLVSGGDGQDRTGTISDIQRLNPHI